MESSKTIEQVVENKMNKFYSCTKCEECGTLYKEALVELEKRKMTYYPESPKEKGVYLVKRKNSLTEETWFEILKFSGEFWITPLFNDNPDDMIIAWLRLTEEF